MRIGALERSSEPPRANRIANEDLAERRRSENADEENDRHLDSERRADPSGNSKPCEGTDGEDEADTGDGYNHPLTSVERWNTTREANADEQEKEDQHRGHGAE